MKIVIVSQIDLKKIVMIKERKELFNKGVVRNSQVDENILQLKTIHISVTCFYVNGKSVRAWACIMCFFAI